MIILREKIFMTDGLPDNKEELNAIKKEAVENYKKGTKGRAAQAAEDKLAEELYEKAKEKARLRKIRFEKIAKKAKKAAPYVAAPVAAGIAYGGAKAAEGIRRKKSNEEIRRKVRGYDSSKKKS